MSAWCNHMSLLSCTRTREFDLHCILVLRVELVLKNWQYEPQECGDNSGSIHLHKYTCINTWAPVCTRTQKHTYSSYFEDEKGIKREIVCVVCGSERQDECVLETRWNREGESKIGWNSAWLSVSPPPLSRTYTHVYTRLLNTLQRGYTQTHTCKHIHTHTHTHTRTPAHTHTQTHTHTATHTHTRTHFLARLLSVARKRTQKHPHTLLLSEFVADKKQRQVAIREQLTLNHKPSTLNPTLFLKAVS